MTKGEQLAVCAEYQLGEPLACNPLGGTRNRNFLLTTTTGKFVVRDRYVGYRDPARVAFDHHALTFLHERSVPVVAPLRSRGGETLWQQGERMWEVFPAVKGRQFRDADPDDIRALAKALAKFHLAGRDFDATKSPRKLGPRGETDPRELFDLVAKLPSAKVKRYQDWIKSAELCDQTFSCLPQTLIHGDVQPANILIDESHVTALVDLDWCDWRPRVYDLAFTILLCCATHETPIDGGDIWSLSQPPVVQADLARMFLETYEEQGWPLSPEENSALRPQIILSWCHVRLAGAMKVEPSRRAEFLARPPHDLTALFPDGIS
ncbi:MAG TPA: phosphotransferase [Tepidisphaeraceae bacterium]|nr:phosphotransferase [Tepidisphaeraceae bacterium]